MSSFQIRNELASGYQSIAGMAGVLNAASSVSSSGSSTADFIVSPNGFYTTIGAALDAASKDTSSIQTIYVSPGSYNEYILIPNNIVLMGPESFPPVVTVTGLTTISNNTTRIQNVNLTTITCNPNISLSDVSFSNCVFLSGVTLPSSQAQTDISLRFHNCIFRGSVFSTELACEFNDCVVVNTVNFTITCSAVNTAPVFAVLNDCIFKAPINIVGDGPTVTVNFYNTIVSVLNSVGIHINTGAATFFENNIIESLKLEDIPASLAGVAVLNMVNSTVISGTATCVVTTNTATITGANNSFSSTNLNIFGSGITYSTNQVEMSPILIQGTLTTSGSITSGSSISAGTTLSSTGNITSGGNISSTGNISAGTTLSSTGNITSGGNISSTGTVTSGTNIISSFIVSSQIDVQLSNTFSVPVPFTIGGSAGFWQSFAQGPNRGAQTIVANNTTGMFQNTGPGAYFNVYAQVVYLYPNGIQSSNSQNEFNIYAGVSSTVIALNTIPVVGTNMLSQFTKTKVGQATQWNGHETYILNFAMYFPANYYFWLSGMAITNAGTGPSGLLAIGDNLNRYLSTLTFTQIV